MNIFRVIYNMIKLLTILVLLLIILLWIPYLSTAIYRFDNPSEFAGNNIYNPYQTMDSTAWIKANFQIQSYAWKGITDGRKNSNENIDSIYSMLEYDVIATSDYMKINRYGENKPSYIPVYEHGYGIFKNHQVCIGAEEVDWFDYFFYQSNHHKQQILNRLQVTNDLVYIAHPRFGGGNEPEDFKYLTNYDGIEALNGFRFSLDYWDTALSTGHYATVLSNDDAHDITNPDQIGQFCTFINVAEIKRENIVSSLKKGNAFGAQIHRELGDSFEIKKEKLKDIANLKYVKLNGDTIRVATDRIAAEIRFIGQDGKLMESVKNQIAAHYIFKETDTYIRIEIFYDNGNKFFLNPLARYDQDLKMPELKGKQKMNTWIFRVTAALILIFLFYLVIKIAKSIQFRRAS